jgi:predicted ATP-grasp superfamily ATP-dependent carboligase
MCLARALHDRGILAPDVRLIPDTIGDGNDPNVPGWREWLVKPLASGGGHGVWPWDRGTPVPRGFYLQELIAGTPGSVVFVAAAGRAVPLGMFRQLTGDPAFGASGCQYCGNILTGSDDALVGAACALASAISEEFDLIGVNGIDFIARDAHVYAVEVNPRWTASMELVERTFGLSVFASHASACTDGVLPAFDFVQARPSACAAGKAVVFAREDVTVGDTSAWIGDSTVRDVPRPGERIPAGRPVCTVFAEGHDDASCYVALVRRADRVYAALAGWKLARIEENHS